MSSEAGKSSLGACRFFAVLALTSGSLIGGSLLGGLISQGSADAAVSGVQVLGWGFNVPGAVSSDGTHVWVANNGNSVTELDAVDRGLVQVISGPSYGFNYPAAISSDGTHVWVANDSGNR